MITQREGEKYQKLNGQWERDGENFHVWRAMEGSISIGFFHPITISSY
jgi:hypothetical protein